MNKVWTEKELSVDTGLPLSMIRRMRLTEGLPYCQVGRRYLYRAEAVAAWFADREAANRKQEPEKNVGKIREII